MKKYIYGALGLLIIFTVIAVIKYSEFQKKAQESELKIAFAAYATAQDSYFKEWKRYSKDPKDAGFNVEGSRLRHKMYFKADELSADEMRLLGQSLPFVQDASYRVIATFEGSGYISYWSFDQDHNLVKLVEVEKK